MFNLFKRKKFKDIKTQIQDEITILNSTTCCFTGHRPQKLPWYFNENDERYFKTRDNVRQAIIEAIKQGYNYFISGMALGYDIMCAELVLELKKEYPFIKLECAIPCNNQEKKWNDIAKKRYYKALKQADKQIILSEYYTDDCMQKRNEYMINKSSLVIALYNGKGGGTKNTIDYAKKQGCKTIIIAPVNNL